MKSSQDLNNKSQNGQVPDIGKVISRGLFKIAQSSGPEKQAEFLKAFGSEDLDHFTNSIKRKLREQLHLVNTSDEEMDKSSPEIEFSQEEKVLELRYINSFPGANDWTNAKRK